MSTVRWVVFDYGQVISQPTAALPDLAAAIGVDPTTDLTAFEQAYWGERRAYDQGLPDLDYWRAVGARLGIAVDGDKAAELTETDTRGWLRLDTGTVELIGDLRAAGVPLALLSNAPTSFGRAVERQPWSAWFRHLVFSGDLGVAKPDAKIWVTLLERLGAGAADCVFLDDRQDNVDGAATAGLDPLLWTNAAAARPWLTARGLLASTTAG